MLVPLEKPRDCWQKLDEDCSGQEEAIRRYRRGREQADKKDIFNTFATNGN